MSSRDAGVETIYEEKKKKKRRLMEGERQV